MTLYIADLRSHASNGVSTGHFFPVAAMYQQIFKEKCKVVVVGGPVYQTRFKENELCLLPYNVSGTTIKDKWHTMKNAIKLFKEAKGQTIVIQQGTVVTAFIAIALFYHRTSKLFMIQYSDEGVRSPLKRFIYWFAKRKIDGIICPNDNVGDAYGIPFCSVPDYIYTGTAEEDCVSESNEKKYDFCLIGRIVEEKGIVEVAKKFANSKYRLIIAGKPSSQELKDRLHKECDNAPNIALCTNYIDDAQYKLILESSRYTMLNYQGEYSRRSSGVVYDTVFAGVPVIGKKCAALQFIEDNKVGYLYADILKLDERTVDYLLSKETNEIFRNNIWRYRTTHQDYKDKLVSFILLQR